MFAGGLETPCELAPWHCIVLAVSLNSMSLALQYDLVVQELSLKDLPEKWLQPTPWTCD